MLDLEVLRPGQLVNHKSTVTNELLVALINKGVIRQGTELLIPRVGLDLSGATTKAFYHIVEVKKAEVIDEVGICKAISTKDNARFIIKAPNIYLIDGMEPTRIAKSYGFKLDGSKRPLGKKRGRKPKKRSF